MSEHFHLRDYLVTISIKIMEKFFENDLSTKFLLFLLSKKVRPYLYFIEDSILVIIIPIEDVVDLFDYFFSAKCDI